MKCLKKILRYLNFKYKMFYNINVLKKMCVKICLYLLINIWLYILRMLCVLMEMMFYFVLKWNC